MVEEVEERIVAYLSTLNSDWRSSPNGIYWHRFYELLQKHGSAEDNGPPKPYILSASGSSNASKLARPGEQLRWAADHGCLDAAIDYLNGLDRQHWNRGLPERWDKHSYF